MWEAELWSSQAVMPADDSADQVLRTQCSSIDIGIQPSCTQDIEAHEVQEPWGMQILLGQALDAVLGVTEHLK